MRTSFATRIRGLLIALSLGFGLCVLASFHFLAQRQVALAANRDVHAVSGMLGAVIRGRMEMLQKLTHQTVSGTRVRGLSGTDAVTAQDEIDDVRKAAGVDALMMTDSAGRLLGWDGLHERPRPSPTDPLLASALEGKPRSGVIAIGDELMVATCEPIYIGEVRQGTLTAYMRLGTALAQELKGDASFEISFVHKGKALASSFSGPAPRVESPENAWTTIVGNVNYIAQYQRLPGTTGWDHLGFMVLRPLDETLGPYQEFSFTFIVVLALVSAASLAIGSTFATRIVSSLEGLVRNAHRIERGEWPERLEVKRTDEIGLLEKAFNDMSDSMRTSQDRLLAMIDGDPLTELDNHRRFKERLQQEAARSTTAGESLALLLLDIDGFATFNSNYGHARGDQKLQEISRALLAASPEYAVVARYGGEEFAVLLPSGTVADAAALFKRVRAVVTEVTLSGGCAELASSKGKAEDLVIAAELAMTRAKGLGAGRVCDFGDVPGSGDADPMRLHRLLSDGTYATIRALAAAVDAKDAYTHGHSDRVAQFASELAAFVGARPEEVDLIHRCGTLHDVGKIGVPDAVLQKPGRLDVEELRIMQTHATLGEYIVGKVPQLASLLPGVRHHHERYDGKGYPDGLAGEAIPRVARYLAIADTFDAMTSDRPYRKGLDPSVALREIEMMAGTQFDPELALAFVRMMRTQPAAEAA